MLCSAFDSHMADSTEVRLWTVITNTWFQCVERKVDEVDHEIMLLNMCCLLY